MREVLSRIPTGSHIIVCANSGSFAAEVESLPPSCLVCGATVGFMLVAEFRTKAERIHKDWIQIAVPIRPTEGRLLAGLRLVPTVLECFQHSFTVINLNNLSIDYELRSFIKDHTDLPYGSVANSWVSTNLCNWYHRGGLYHSEYNTFKTSFAWDGDVYGWDEAVLFVRKPISLVSYTKPSRRFDHWLSQTVHRGVNWVRVVDGRLSGGYQKATRRADVIAWDKYGIPEGEIQLYSGQSTPQVSEPVGRESSASTNHLQICHRASTVTVI